MSKTVYINDSPLIIDEIYQAEYKFPQEYLLMNESKNNLDEAILFLEEGKTNGIIFLSDNVQQTWKQLISRYTLIEAAGGLVKIPSGKMLFIFRNGKWDLPKGKAEFDETPNVTALREVEEECGLKNLKIVKELNKTYHTYKEKERSFFKVTHWYQMTNEEEETLIPQTEEGITEASWFSENEVKEKVIPNTYSSIKELLKSILS